MLGRPRYGVDVGPAAERVDQRVVADGVGRAVEAHGAGRGVDGRHAGDEEFDPRPAEQVPQRQVPWLPPDDELVEPDPLHEPVHGIDEGDGDVGAAAQLSVEALGRDETGVAGPRDHDVMAHGNDSFSDDFSYDSGRGFAYDSAGASATATAHPM